MEQAALRELVEGICGVMSDNIISIVLYGSVARGTATNESDVDIAIILKDKLDKVTEDALSDIIVDLNLKYDIVLSVVDIQQKEIDKWGNVLPFFKNVAKDGVVLWKAA